jgi:hypothetical protein
MIKNLIKTFTNTPSRAIAFMGLQNGGPEPWTFFAGQVNNGVFTAIPGPAHGQMQQTLSFGGDGPVVQKSKLPVSTDPLFSIGSDQLSADQRTLAFKIENPKQQFFFNTDCISCHTASSRTADLQLGDKGEISARLAVPANITGYVAKTEAQDDTWNLRNFGYFGAKPTVSGRTAAETVAVVQWLNQNVVVPGSNLNGPGRDCSGVDAQVWKCFRDGKANCFASCKGAPTPTNDTPPPPPVPLTVNPAVTGDPCVSPEVGGEASVQIQPQNGGTILATIGGNDSACLSRVVGGAFVGTGQEGAVTVVCTDPAHCVVDVTGTDPSFAKVSLVGAEATRFKTFFRANDDESFRTRALNGTVQINCAGEQCDIIVAADRTRLEPTSNVSRINPG